MLPSKLLLIIVTLQLLKFITFCYYCLDSLEARRLPGVRLFRGDDPGCYTLFTLAAAMALRAKSATLLYYFARASF